MLNANHTPTLTSSGKGWTEARFLSDTELTDSSFTGFTHKTNMRTDMAYREKIC